MEGKFLIAIYCLVASSFLGSIQAHEETEAEVFDNLRRDLFFPNTRMSPDQVAELVTEILGIVAENYYGQQIPHLHDSEILQISDLCDLTRIHGQNCKNSNYFTLAKAQKEEYKSNSNIAGFIDEYRSRQLERCLKDQPDFVPNEDYYL